MQRLAIKNLTLEQRTALGEDVTADHDDHRSSRIAGIGILAAAAVAAAAAFITSPAFAALIH